MTTLPERRHSRKILIIDDDQPLVRLIENELAKENRYQLFTSFSGKEGLKKVDEIQPDLVLLDYQLNDLDGLQALQTVKKNHPGTQVILMSAHGSIEIAVSAMRLGAYDFLSKPFPFERLLITTRNALVTHTLQKEVEDLKSFITPSFRLEEMVGQSKVMQAIFKSIQQTSNSDITVLILGESGTGKELVARALHQLHPTRRDKPFVAVNCAAFPEQLLESELFGYEKGAFTGADERRPGKFEQAHLGTIFLDEIAEMSTTLQAKLTRVLQEREFQRLGGEDYIKVDVRVISATNRNLDVEVRSKRFRDDLFYRLSVFPIKMPTLRERKEDIPLLAQHFIEKINARDRKDQVKGIEPEAIKRLINYQWLGNVRELENVMERSMVVAAGERITVHELPVVVQELGRVGQTMNIGALDYQEQTLPELLEQIEVETIKKALEDFDGNVSKVAKALGIGRATIYRKAEKYPLFIQTDDTANSGGPEVPDGEAGGKNKETGSQKGNGSHEPKPGMKEKI